MVPLSNRLVACAAVDDYVSGVIKKHEHTRADKKRTGSSILTPWMPMTSRSFISSAPTRVEEILQNVIYEPLTTTSPQPTGFPCPLVVADPT